MPDKTPAPDIVAEVESLVERLRPLLDRTIEGDGETLRFTVTVPKEFAILAAWLIFKADMAAAGKPDVLPRPVTLQAEDGRRLRDWQRAGDYFRMIIGEQLDRDWAMLRDLTHPMLFPAPEEPVRPPYPGAIDDDIPF